MEVSKLENYKWYVSYDNGKTWYGNCCTCSVCHKRLIANRIIS